jgi:hypothetical protein
MKKRLALSILLLAIGCAKGPDGETKKAENTFKEASSVSIAKCNGQGTEHSGIYAIESDAGEGKCSDNKDGGQVLGVGFLIDCKQNNETFNCKTQGDDVAIVGCINQDGSFKISSASDLNSFEQLSNTQGAQKTDKMTHLEGVIQGDSATANLKYSAISSRGNKKKSCNFSWKVTMELKHKSGEEK